MALTPAQLTALKANIASETDAYLVEQRTAGSDSGIAVWYNTMAVPDFFVWKTRVSSDEAFNAIIGTGTGGFIARSQGERDYVRALLSQGSINPSLANIRQALADAFSGAGASAVTTRDNLLALSKRTATNAEKLFSTGTGSQADPATMSFQGLITPQDVSEARAWQP